MTTTPPLLSQEILKRVLRLARIDGASILGVAGLFALLAASLGDVSGAVVGLIVAGAGALELHGAALLRHGEARGIKWLVSSQLFLLAAMLSYCAMRLIHVELGQLRPLFHSMLNSPMLQGMWAVNQELGMTEEIFLRQAYTLIYVAVALATLIYQGGMAVYYLRRREAITRALADA